MNFTPMNNDGVTLGPGDVIYTPGEISRASATLTILAALVGTNSFDSAPAVCRTAIRIADEMFRQLENTDEPDDESLGNE